MHSISFTLSHLHPVLLILSLQTWKQIQLSDCCCSATQSCPALCHPMDCSMPGFPVLHCLPEFAQTHVHWLSDAVQPSNPLSPSSALSLSQNQHLFQWVGSLHQVAKGIGASTSASVLLMNIQAWFPLGLTFILRYINWTCYHFLLSEPITDLVAGMRLHVQSVSPKLKWYMQQLEFFLSLFLSCGE